MLRVHLTIREANINYWGKLFHCSPIVLTLLLIYSVVVVMLESMLKQRVLYVTTKNKQLLI